ncbi:MAG: helix-turn-helix transcriptional regulator [Bacteroides sp.]
MDKMKFYTHEEMKDEVIGKKGTPERDKYDERLEMFLIGEAIKRTRLEKNLTQEDLGKLVGVQKAQISRIENGNNLTFATVIRLFKAMGVSAKLEIGNLGKVALC